MNLASINSAANVLSQLEKQRRLMDSLTNPFPVQRWLEQERRRQRLLEDPFGFRESEKKLRQMVQPPLLEQFARQQRLLDELIKGPAILSSLGGLSSGASATVADRADGFRDELVVEVEAEEVEEGTDPLPRLAAEREAILTCLARMKESAVVAGLLDALIPDVILALILAAVVIGEVADEILREREVELAA